MSRTEAVFWANSSVGDINCPECVPASVGCSRLPDKDYADLLTESWAYFRYEPRTTEKTHYVWCGLRINPWPWSVKGNTWWHLSHWNGAHLVGYADDVTAIIVARNIEEVYKVMSRGERTQSGGKNGVNISYEEVYTVENRHHDMRHHFDNKKSGQLPWHSAEP